MAERRGAGKDTNLEPGNLRFISEFFSKIFCDLTDATKHLFIFFNMKYMLKIIFGFKKLINLL